jgi:thymidine kinase
MGELHIVIGPMFSGKTKFIINKYHEINDDTAIVINHDYDNRYDESKQFLVSHDKLKIPCRFMKNLREIYNNDDFVNVKYIFINEAQFFEDLIKMVTIFVYKYGMIVFVSGLDGDFKQKKIGNILDLIPHCDTVVKLKGVCHCGKESIFSKRLSNEKEQISIGNDNYSSVCRNCYS